MHICLVLGWQCLIRHSPFQAQYIFIHKAIAEVIEEELPTPGNDDGPIYANSKYTLESCFCSSCVCVIMESVVSEIWSHLIAHS